MTATVASTFGDFLADGAAHGRLRTSTVRAYRYELAAAAADPRFSPSLDTLSLADLETWISRDAATPARCLSPVLTACFCSNVRQRPITAARADMGRVQS